MFIDELKVVNSCHDNDHRVDLIAELEIAEYLKTENTRQICPHENDLYVGCRDTDIAYDFTIHSQTMS